MTWPDQGHVVAVDLVGEVIEHTEVGEHEEFVAHFLLNALDGFIGGLVLLSEGERRCQNSIATASEKQSDVSWVSSLRCIWACWTEAPAELPTSAEWLGRRRQPGSLPERRTMEAAAM